jgi:hypothetical protein
LLLHIPAGGVEAILDTVVQQLLDNPDRTFVYADLAFFVKWWQELHEDTKAAVRYLVQQGRFEFTGGGIVQHDEATSHYSGMVDQMSLGMRFLQAEFGHTPKIAWQVRDNLWKKEAAVFRPLSCKPKLWCPASIMGFVQHLQDLVGKSARRAWHFAFSEVVGCPASSLGDVLLWLCGCSCYR